MESKHSSRTETLLQWCTQLTFEQLPEAVIERAKDCFLDWLACAIAGRSHVSVSALALFSKQMGPENGQSEFIDSRLGNSSPAFTALVNGASSHVVEQDDLHNGSIVHPATVVFPAALAVAQNIGANGKEFITACVVGYEVACRTGEYLGKSHYQAFHTTATAGVCGAAVAAGHLLQLDSDQMLSALGTAGTQAAGLWQFLLDATHSKQIHTGKACFDGMLAAYAARDGLLGPREVLEGRRGMGAAMVPGTTRLEAIDQDLGTKFSILESSFKWHASCRHTHPSVDALLSLMQRQDLEFDDIEEVTAYTYQAAIDVLSMSEKGETVHQSKFSMGFVLAVAAKYGQAMVTDFTEEALHDVSLREFQRRVKMALDPKIEALFPNQWLGTVDVVTKSGVKYSEIVTVVKGDPGWSLGRDEIETKVRSLARYAGIDEMERLETTIRRVWGLESEMSLGGFAFQ
ncbi:hypothetical protein F5884DRAFT_742925 [Xylogone sp. PMI_703]|nr:hypothetical protein F5884DRAFT_742925 [Xylogone sp. PMI_703]